MSPGQFVQGFLFSEGFRNADFAIGGFVLLAWQLIF
jgi:hypothetical protein